MASSVMPCKGLRACLAGGAGGFGAAAAGGCAVASLGVVAPGCKPTAPESAAVPAGEAGFAASLQERLLDAKPGDVIDTRAPWVFFTGTEQPIAADPELIAALEAGQKSLELGREVKLGEVG